MTRGGVAPRLPLGQRIGLNFIPAPVTCHGHVRRAPVPILGAGALGAKADGVGLDWEYPVICSRLGTPDRSSCHVAAGPVQLRAASIRDGRARVS